MNEYPYCKKNLLEVPQKYQLTPYEGIDFLKSYKKPRLELLKKNDEKNYDIRNIIKNLKKNNQSKNTIDILINILQKLIRDQLNEEELNDFNFILKKFEIKKKIFSEHNLNINENNSNFHDIRNYIVFSVICNILYEKSSNLKFLNSGLKVNDLISSIKESINDKIDWILFRYAVQMEINSVTNLLKKKCGIDI